MKKMKLSRKYFMSLPSNDVIKTAPLRRVTKKEIKELKSSDLLLQLILGKKEEEI